MGEKIKASKGSRFQQGRIWWYQLRINGKRERYSLQTADETEALVKIKEIRKRLELGISPLEMERQKLTLSELIERYKDYSRSRKAPNTADRDKRALERFIGVVGNRNLTQITGEEIEQYVINLKGLKPATVNRELTSIKAMFTKAVEWELRADNPARKVQHFKVQQKPITWLTDKEIKTLLDIAPEGFWRDTIIVLLETGIRLGEYASLKVENIDIRTRILNITASKTYSTRPARITDHLIPIVKKWLKTGMPPLPNKTTISCRIRRMGETIGLKISPHIFRHTFASRLVMNGVNIRTVQALMGHNDIKTTMIYSHLAPDYLKEADRAEYNYS